MPQSITCPNCRFQIEVSEALSAQAREELRREFQADARRKETILNEREEDLRKRELALDDTRRSLEAELENRLNAERARLQEEAKSAAKETIALEMRDLQDQLAAAKNKIVAAQEIELELRKDRRDLEEQKREQELALMRALDQEREKIREKAVQESDEKHRLAEADKEKVIADLRDQINILKRRAEQGSMQVQGEVMELDLEEMLRTTFSQDEIEPVAVGVHGGDIKQHVRDRNGLDCGTILWESKRTKAWNDNWLPKLREDQRASRAHIAVLLTAELPKAVTTFAYLDGVWVTCRSCLPGLAMALRAGMIEAARSRRAAEDKHGKIELLHAYLTGPEFRQRVEGIVEPMVTMRSELESEKRSVHRLWRKREKQLERAVVNAAALYGDLGGIMGASLPKVANLELPPPPSDDAEDPVEVEETASA